MSGRHTSASGGRGSSGVAALRRLLMELRRATLADAPLPPDVQRQLAEFGVLSRCIPPYSRGIRFEKMRLEIETLADALVPSRYQGETSPGGDLKLRRVGDRSPPRD